MRLNVLIVLLCLAVVGCRTTETVERLDLAEVSFAEDDTQWLTILIDGHKAGHAAFSRRVIDGKVVHRERVHFELKRDVFSVEMTTEDRTLETREGAPLAFRSTRIGAGVDMVVRGRITPDGQIVMHTTSGGRTVKSTRPWPEGAVMAEGARLFEKEHGYQPGTEYELLLFTPSDQRAHRAATRVNGWRQVDVLGDTERLLEAEQTLHIGLGKLTSFGYMNAEHQVRKLVMPVLGVNMEMIVCPRAVALSPNHPADFLAMALVRAPRPIEPAALKGPLRYTMRFKRDAGASPLTASDEQEVVALPDRPGTWRVTVRVRPMPRGVPLPYAGRDPIAQMALQPNKWLQTDAEPIRALATKAVGEATDAAQAARNIEAFVQAYVADKNLNIGYATALETVHNRAGDCTEHALLTAALCRAAGIPARVACGLARFKKGPDGRDLFGPHAWAQVYLNGRWYSLDAALGRFTSGHILTDTGGGEPSDFFRGTALLGNIEILNVEPVDQE